MTNNILSGFEFVELCYKNGYRSFNAIVEKFGDYVSISTVEKWHSRIRNPKPITQKALYYLAKEEGWL